ncbi:MAG: hypothetical protein EXQ95_13170 [Alphaproteobacteria bacterium]|nr:hypothetical protein [Alphaproteobacteria bacterium]
MNTSFRALAGRRVLVIDADSPRAEAVIRMLTAAGAAAEAATALHQALDLLEAAEPAFDGAIIGERLADGDGAALARAIRTTPLLFDLRLVILAAGTPPWGIDVACAWPATPESLTAAIVGPTSPVAQPTTEAPVLDLVELESIAGGLTAELTGMLRRFADRAQEAAGAAMAAAVATDAGVAKGLAHTLKGAAFSAGAMRLGQAARSFEAAAAAADWEAAAAIDLPGEARALAQAIHALPKPTE